MVATAVEKEQSRAYSILPHGLILAHSISFTTFLFKLCNLVVLSEILIPCMNKIKLINLDATSRSKSSSQRKFCSIPSTIYHSLSKCAWKIAWTLRLHLFPFVASGELNWLLSGKWKSPLSLVQFIVKHFHSVWPFPWQLWPDFIAEERSRRDGNINRKLAIPTSYQH